MRVCTLNVFEMTLVVSVSNVNLNILERMFGCNNKDNSSQVHVIGVVNTNKNRYPCHSVKAASVVCASVTSAV